MLKKYVGEGGAVVIPDGVTKIGAFAFDGCKEVTSVVISSSVTTIGRSAFSRCAGLISVTIPYGVVYIDDEAFWNCRKLKSLVIPASVKNIGNRVFQGCREMESVTLPVALKNIGLHAFDGYSYSFRRKDITASVSVKSTTNTSTSSTYGKKTPTTSSVNKSKESSDKNESIIDRFNKAIEKEPSYAKRAATTKSDSYVKTTASATKTTKTPAKPACDVPKTSENKPAKTSSYTSVNIPNQSTRLRMNLAYRNHPLRKEYEAEREKLYEKNPKRILPTIIMLIPWIMIIGYGIIFFNISNSLIIVLLGILNLFAVFFVTAWSFSLDNKFKNNTTGVAELKQKYWEKGLYEVSDTDLFESPCGETNSDGEYICSATGEHLNWNDYNWCQQKGNCRYCRRFATAYLCDTPEHWPHDFKR